MPTPRRTPKAADAVRVGLIGLAVALVIVVTYLPVLRNEPVWDDADLTTKNPYVQAWSGLARIFTTDIWTASAKEEPSSFYRPLSMASFVVNRMIGGNGAASYHAANLLLHVANAALLALLALRQRVATRLAAALVPALWFAVAPVNVEAVAWISGRFDLLGTTLVLAALVVNAGSGGAARAGAAALVTAGLFCKESFVVGLVLLVLQDVLVLRRRLADELVKYAGVGLGLVVFFALRWLVGVMSVAAVAGTGFLPLVASYAFLLATFGRTLVYPVYLDPYRGYAPPSAAACAIALGAAAVICAAVLWLLRARPNDARVRGLAFGAAWVFLAFAPATLTGPNLDIVGDRYGYFPLVGAFLALAPLVDAAWPRAPASSAIVAALAFACLGVFALRVRVRLPDWQNERTLFEASVRDDPENAYALYSLGYLEALEHNFEVAEGLLGRSLAKRPSSWRTLNAICFVRLHRKQPREAVTYCAESTAINPQNPRAWTNLASAHVNLREWSAAADAASRAIELKPRSAEARYLRAAALANLGAIDRAREDLRVALDAQSDHPGALNLLAQFHARGIP